MRKYYDQDRETVTESQLITNELEYNKI